MLSGLNSFDSLKDVALGRPLQMHSMTMQEVEGGIPDFEPFVRYNNFGDSSIDFNVILRGQEFVNQYLIRHEFVKRLHKRYKEEGIDIPFPIRTVQMGPPARKGPAKPKKKGLLRR